MTARFDTLSGWLDWLTRLHPKRIDLGLDRVRKVWLELGAPRPGGNVITVSGSNGKGSSVAFADACLRAAGYRVACYTSPHLRRYNERIKIDAEAVDDAALCRAFARVDDARGDVLLTYFEFGTLAALLLFADADVDVAVLEVGLGGRLDAVNIVDADVALITGIALEHQDWLGKDRESIGREKAGIMRAGRPAVYAGTDIPDSIRQHAEQQGTSLRVAGEDYHVEHNAGQWDLHIGDRVRRSLPVPGMRGAVQVDNAAGALVALDCLAERLPLDQAAVRTGLLGARVPGRFEVRPGEPTWVLDVAHNPQAASVLDQMLADYFVNGERIALCGMLGDKDVAGVATALSGRFDRWYTVDLSDQPRGMDDHALADTLREQIPDRAIEALGSPARAMERLAVECDDKDMIVVFGSFLTVGAALEWLDG